MKALSGYVKVGYAPAASLVAYKSSVDVLSKGVTLVVTIAAARTLPAGDFGVFALAMTTGWLLGVASDAGLPMYLATRVAHAAAANRDPRAIVDAVMRWRGTLGGIAAIAGGVVGWLLAPAAMVLAFALVVSHQLLGAMLETLAHAYRGLGRTDVEATITLGHRGGVALAALAALAMAPSLLMLSVALVLPPLTALAVSHRMVRRLTAPAHTASATGAASVDAIDRRVFVRDVAPLGFAVILSALYFRCDVYFLERLHGVESVGFYNAGFRIAEALRVFPAAVLAVAYPALCRATDARPLRVLSAGLLAISMPVAGTLYVSAGGMLTLVYGETYAVAAAALQVLAWCVPLFFVNYALTHQLVAWQRQAAYLRIAAAALAVNLAGNAMLIPGGGMVGAALSTLITEIAVSGGCLWALRRR